MEKYGKAEETKQEKLYMLAGKLYEKTNWTRERRRKKLSGKNGNRQAKGKVKQRWRRKRITECPVLCFLEKNGVEKRLKLEKAEREKKSQGEKLRQTRDGERQG